MYEIISQMIGFSGSYAGQESVILQACCALIVVFTCVLIDMVYRVFSHFWRD